MICFLLLMLWDNNSFGQICLLIGIVFQVSNVAHGSLVHYFVILTDLLVYAKDAIILYN